MHILLSKCSIVLLLAIALAGLAYSGQAIGCEMGQENHGADPRHGGLVSLGKRQGDTQQAVTQFALINQHLMGYQLSSYDQAQHHCDNCCGTGCGCPSQICAPASIVFNHEHNLLCSCVTEKINLFSQHLIKVDISSLYRPPISA